jgi:hypothetical protein
MIVAQQDASFRFKISVIIGKQFSSTFRYVRENKVRWKWKKTKFTVLAVYGIQHKFLADLRNKYIKYIGLLYCMFFSWSFISASQKHVWNCKESSLSRFINSFTVIDGSRSTMNWSVEWKREKIVASTDISNRGSKFSDIWNPKSIWGWPLETFLLFMKFEIISVLL